MSVKGPSVSGEELRDQLKSLSEEIVGRQYKAEADLWKRFGKVGWEKSLRDQQYHLAYLAEAVLVSEPELFIHYVRWLKQLFTSLTFPHQALLSMLHITSEVIGEKLKGNLPALAIRYIEESVRQIEQMADTPEGFLPVSARWAGLAREYLGLLLNGNRHAASALILKAVDGDVSVKDVYLNVFQPVLREIGRLWQMNKVSVAQEHYCTAATQLIMSQLAPHVFSTPRKGLRMVAACIGGELHEVGARMVADFFEIAGWDSYYLGANAPAPSIRSAMLDQQAQVLAVSATMTFHLGLVEDLIRVLRDSAAGSTTILVGGYPFHLAPGLWRKIGADGFGLDAEDAVHVAEGLMKLNEGSQ